MKYMTSLNFRTGLLKLKSSWGNTVITGYEFILGWGKASHPGSSEQILRQSHLRVVSNSECHRLNKPGSGIDIRQSMICAGYGPSSPRSGCHGDSGGPFVCKYGNQWTLHGAVSWGSGICSTRYAYTVFARVANFRNWIYQNTRV